jgi:hypothetical protein
MPQGEWQQAQRIKRGEQGLAATLQGQDLAILNRAQGSSRWRNTTFSLASK